MESPTPRSLRESLVQVAEALGGALERDPELARALADLAVALQAAATRGAAAGESGDPVEALETEAAAPPTEAVPAPVPEPDEAPRTTVPPADPPSVAPRPTREQLEDLATLFSGDGQGPAPDDAPSRPRERRTHSPRRIADRCRLKHQACELMAELAGSPEREPDLRPEIETLVQQARTLENCELWMLRREAREWVAAENWEILGHTFANLARAMTLAHAAEAEAGDRGQDDMEEILTLAAEAQRATRDAVEPCVAPGRNFEDADQLAAFRWIAERAETLRIFIDRHMRLDDPADPTAWESLLDRLTTVERRRKTRSEKARAEKQLRNRIAYEAKRLEEAPAAEIDQRVEKIARAVGELAAIGIAPSDVALREVLLPVFDRLSEAPDFEVEPYRLVLREADRHLARLEESASADEAADASEAVETPEVAEVRRLLDGRAAVLIGGDERRDAGRRLREAFGLSDLIWVATRPHEPVEALQPPIMRDEVAVVLLAIRWSSHSFAGVRDFCETAGKPLVRLPGGYGVNRVAAEIVAQASEALARAERH